MTSFLPYIARAGLYLGLFYAFYLLVMRRTTFFRLNRTLLLAGSFLCLLLPLIRLRTVKAAAVASDLTMVAGSEPAEQALRAAFPWEAVLPTLFVVGAIATLALYLVSARKMGRLIRKGESLEREGCKLVLLDEDIPSFSWGRTVVMSRKDLEQNPAIFTHELMHIRCMHSVDLLLFLPLQMLFWWNPLVWITREELRLLHEYEADERVIQKGIDATQYQLLLVRKAVGEHRFTLASGFRHAKLKNRIAMMLKPSSSGWIRWSYLAIIPVLGVFMFACNPSRKTESQEFVTEQVISTERIDSPEKEAVPFNLIERRPTFNGGDAGEFSQWVNSRLNYPETAKADGAQGRVILQFTIGTDGEVYDVKVLRGVREDLDNEAIRVISASPKWEPGYNADGEAVPVTFSFPIVYKLQ
ncbi:MAG: M56 family metallopeptidase [Bacteroidales bacterium]|nr:M56 family metallopeptidase [Bacteroidales bacterium]